MQKSKYNSKNFTFSHRLQFRIQQLGRAIPIKSVHSFTWTFYILFKRGWCRLNSAQLGPKNNKIHPSVDRKKSILHLVHLVLNQCTLANGHRGVLLWACVDNSLPPRLFVPSPAHASSDRGAGRVRSQTLCQPAHIAIKNTTEKDCSVKKDAGMKIGWGLSTNTKLYSRQKKTVGLIAFISVLSSLLSTFCHDWTLSCKQFGTTRSADCG